jgi:cytochrome bd-type quinol oxidase subunit 1
VSWMKIPCSEHVDFPQICGKAFDWTVLYLNNICEIKIFHWIIDNLHALKRQHNSSKFRNFLHEHTKV